MPTCSTFRTIRSRLSGILAGTLLSMGLVIALVAPVAKPASAVANAPVDTSMPWSMHLDFDPGGYCSGFMLTEHWLVTAGHCVDGRTTADDLITVSYMEGGRRVVVYSKGTATYYPHPNYSTANDQNDIGLVRLHGTLVAPELRAPLYADVLTQPPFAWRGHTDFAYIAGYGRGSDPGEVEGCADPDVVSGTRRLGVLGLTGDVEPATGAPLAVEATPQLGTPCDGDSGSPWTFRHAFKHFVFAVHAGGPDDLKRATLLHPKMPWIIETTAEGGRPISCPSYVDGDADLTIRQCTEGHRMLLREGTGSPTIWRTGATNLSSVTVGDVDGNGADDLLRFAANRFFVSWAGRSVWVGTPATHVTGATYAFGDFDGNGTTDILRSLNGSWHALFSRPDRTWSDWQVTRITSDRLMPEVIAGDFDGNGVDDLFRSRNGEWRVSWGASGGSHTSWQLVGSSSAPAASLRAGDFDGDGADEIFYANGSTWRVSFSPHSRAMWSKWVTVASSQHTNLEVADFDENGSDDVFRSTGSEWRISYSTRNRSLWSRWTRLRSSSVAVSAAAFGDFDDLGGTDALYFAACPQYC